jgi:HK97 family phage major capsid protein
LISDKIYEEGVFAKEATRAVLDPGTRSISYRKYKNRSRKDGFRHGGFTVAWEGEGEVLNATRLKFETQQINLSSLKAVLPVTNDLLANARGLESEIMMFAPRAFAFEVDRAMFEGKGAGNPLGIMNSGLKVAIAKESGQTAATVVIDNIIKAEARTASENAKWYANKNVLPQLATLKFGDNSPAFLVHSNQAEKGLNATLFGRPLKFVEHCETVGAEGDLLLADWQAYRLLDPGTLRSEGSMHVYFLTDEYAFRFVKEVNGAPMYDQPLDPLKGSTTLSEFITIAVR